MAKVPEWLEDAANAQEEIERLTKENEKLAIDSADLQTLRQAYKNLGARYEKERSKAISRDAGWSRIASAASKTALKAIRERDAAVARERDLRAAVVGSLAAFESARYNEAVGILRVALAQTDD